MWLWSRIGGLLVVATLLAAVGAFVACSQTPVVPKEAESCKLQVVNMTIIASPRINLADNGEPRPVQLRIYQLGTDIRLNNASFDGVWKADKATLQEDLIKSEELSVYPDSRTDIQFERDEKAMVVGGVALFRNPRGRSWYTTFELPPSPGKGACTPVCAGGECDGSAPKPNPHYVVWIDGSKVDDGSDHIDEYPRSGRRTEVHLPFSEPASPEPASPEPATSAK
jgi:type VI secretion system protein VasD